MQSKVISFLKRSLVLFSYRATYFLEKHKICRQNSGNVSVYFFVGRSSFTAWTISKSYLQEKETSYLPIIKKISYFNVFFLEDQLLFSTHNEKPYSSEKMLRDQFQICLMHRLMHLNNDYSVNEKGNYPNWFFFQEYSKLRCF